MKCSRQNSRWKLHGSSKWRVTNNICINLHRFIGFSQNNKPYLKRKPPTTLDQTYFRHLAFTQCSFERPLALTRMRYFHGDVGEENLKDLIRRKTFNKTARVFVIYIKKETEVILEESYFLLKRYDIDVSCMFRAYSTPPLVRQYNSLRDGAKSEVVTELKCLHLWDKRTVFIYLLWLKRYSPVRGTSLSVEIMPDCCRCWRSKLVNAPKHWEIFCKVLENMSARW